MMLNTFLFACLLFAAQIAAFQWNNYQVPGYTTRNEHRYKTISAFSDPTTNFGLYGTNPILRPPVYRSAGDPTTPSFGQVNPTFKNVNTYIQSFKPIGATVLISYSADDDGTAASTTGQNTLAPSQSTLLTGIVVSTGAGVASTRLAEGSRVYFSATCAKPWTVIDWTAIYGSEKAAMMAGRYINGVDINNAEGWNSNFVIGNPALYYGGSVYTANSVLPASSVTTFSSLSGYSQAGDAAGSLAISADAELPTQNANQQANYLLCSETDIWGIVSESHFPNIEGGHYEQPQTILRGLRNPTPYTKTSA